MEVAAGKAKALFASAECAEILSGLGHNILHPLAVSAMAQCLGPDKRGL